MFARSSLAVLVGLAVLSPDVVTGQLRIVDNLPGTFIDISGAGTPLGLSGDSEAIITSTVANAAFPAGVHGRDARATDNGRFCGST